MLNKTIAKRPFASNLRTVQEVDQLRRDLPILVEIAEWVRNYLAETASDARTSGRCMPLRGSGHQRRKDFDDGRVDSESIRTKSEGIVAAYRKSFFTSNLPKVKPKLDESILIIFPEVALKTAPLLIDEVQRRLKPLFVAAGLMLGEFTVERHTRFA